MCHYRHSDDVLGMSAHPRIADMTDTRRKVAMCHQETYAVQHKRKQKSRLATVSPKSDVLLSGCHMQSRSLPAQTKHGPASSICFAAVAVNRSSFQFSRVLRKLGGLLRQSPLQSRGLGS